MNGECTIEVGIGSEVACNDVQCERGGQPLTIESVVLSWVTGSSGISKIEVSWVFFGSA